MNTINIRNTEIWPGLFLPTQLSKLSPSASSVKCEKYGLSRASRGLFLETFSMHFPDLNFTKFGEVDFHFALSQFWSWFFSIEEQLFIPQQIDRKRWNKLGKADVFLVKYTLSGHEWVLMEKWLFPVFGKLVVECGPSYKWKL